ncbi:hypothetical protein EX895_000671 [Sporisorium graminicola]|uniref:PHD-type domain-containing protein n=1 Tax=Sporisorium graminicola TaxID=280036 RepID=A0A4U7L0M2_9BASI|nr:hypothetical protein EX895_000671 [Sporisorium graminicola]TKY90673.1 hypothetical protein EX895_000671 [Sporisorium graminicola]
MQPGDPAPFNSHVAVEDREASSSTTMDVDSTPPPTKRTKSTEASRSASAEPYAHDAARAYDGGYVSVKVKAPQQSGVETTAVKKEEGVDSTASGVDAAVEAASSTVIKSELAPAEASSPALAPLSHPGADAASSSSTPPPPPQLAAKKKKVSSSSTGASKKDASSSSSTTKSKKGTSSTKKASASNDASSSRGRVKVEILSPPPTATLPITASLAEEDEEEDNALYCICQRRQDDVEGGMIMCDRCDSWYHYRCVGITEEDVELVDQFICPPCHTITGEQTTYKAACARPRCRRAAMTPFSKYCSERCGVLSVTAKLGALNVDRNKQALEVLRADSRVAVARRTEGLTQRMDGVGGVWERVVADQLGGGDALIKALGLAEAFTMMVRDPADTGLPNGVSNGVPEPPVNGASSTRPTAPASSSATSLLILDEQHALITQQLRIVDVQKQHLNARLDRLDLRSTLLHLVSDRVPTLAPVGSSTSATTTAEAADEDEEMHDTDRKPKKKKGGSKGKTKSSADVSGGPRCGYDQRLHWDDATFDAWARAPPGSRMLAHETALDGILDDDSPEPSDQPRVVCASAKRKCRRHLDWSNLCELALDAEKACLNNDSRALTQSRLALVERQARLRDERQAVQLLLRKELEAQRRASEQRDRDVAMRMANEGTRRGVL